MSVESIVGFDGLAINVESLDELFDAIDALHTQVMDNLSGHPKYNVMLRILEHTLDELDRVICERGE